MKTDKSKIKRDKTSKLIPRKSAEDIYLEEQEKLWVTISAKMQGQASKPVNSSSIRHLSIISLPLHFKALSRRKRRTGTST